jgi:hypothetical protein
MSNESFLIAQGILSSAVSMAQILPMLGLPDSKERIERYLESSLKIKDTTIVADQIIQFYAEHGNITINGTKVHSSSAVGFRTTPKTSMIISETLSTTDTTRIETVGAASISLQGGARIIQTEGGIIFTT